MGASTRKAGRPTKWCPEMRRDLLVQLQLHNDERACKAAGISVSTLHDWLLKSEAGDARFRGFSEEVQCARGLRPANIAARLVTYNDYKADDAYLKHTANRDLHRSKRRKAEADADLAEAMARRAKAEADVAEQMAGKVQGGGLLIAGVDDLLDMLTGETRDRVEEELARREAVLVGWRRDILPLGGGGEDDG